MSTLPASARIVIIGGGAVGCSIAYHLAKLGQRDVLLLEKKALTAGSTWHAAGLVGQLRSKVNLTRLMQYSAKLCATIGAETGQDVGFHQVGSIRLASSDARWEELKRNAAAAKSCGLDVELIGPAEIKEKFPLVDLQGVRGATWIASDGYVDPYSLTMAYAKGARAGGVKIVEGVTVTGFRQANGRITHVAHRPWRCRLRDRGERRRLVGAPCRRNGGPRTAGHGAGAPVSRHREIAAHSRSPADAA